MAKRKPVRIGDVVFKTKKAATEAVRGILYAYNVGSTLGAEHEAFMVDLFRLHPEWELKRGCGIASVQVEQNLGTRGFWLTRTDGTRTDISFVKSLSPPRHEHDVRAALRTEVREQVREFKAASLTPGTICPITGHTLDAGNAHVDHAPPEFDELIAMFLVENQLSVDGISVNPTEDGSTDTLLADRELAARWQEFHREHARLRLVTKTANLSVLRRGR